MTWTQICVIILDFYYKCDKFLRKKKKRSVCTYLPSFHTYMRITLGHSQHLHSFRLRGKRKTTQKKLQIQYE